MPKYIPSIIVELTQKRLLISVWQIKKNQVVHTIK